MASVEPCLIKIDAFEGPLDLLLYLIKKNELDIYNIPIALITEQYLEYLNMMRELSIEVAGEYLVIAATLGYIKSRMLLPKPELADSEEEDPRAELVKRLLEYEQYKEAAQSLIMDSLILERDVFARKEEYLGDDEQYRYEDRDGDTFIKADLWSLIDAFREVLKRAESILTSHLVELHKETVDEKIAELRLKLKNKGHVIFSDLFNAYTSRIEIIVTFLAILELIKNGTLRVFQDRPYGIIQIWYINP